MLASEIAKLVAGTIHGDSQQPAFFISDLINIQAQSLVVLLKERELVLVEASLANIVICGEDVSLPLGSNKTYIKVAYPKMALKQILEVFSVGRIFLKDQRENSFIAKTAKLGNNIFIGPGCFIGENVEIGDNTVLKANVSIYEYTLIGKNVLIHSGAVIGSDGFGFIRENDEVYKMPQIGRVVIQDEVEIGANTTIDRATISETIIGKGTKIDNLVQVGHNCRIGENCLIASHCAIGGSSVFEDNVTIGGYVAFSDHIHVGRGAMIAGRSGVIKDVPAGKIYSGFPAREHREELKFWAKLHHLVKKI